MNHLLQELQNCNLLLDNYRQENVESHQIKISQGQGQRQIPKKVVGEGKFHVVSSPYLPEMLRGLKQNLVHTRTQTTETEADLSLSVRMSPAETRVSSGLLWVRGSDCSRCEKHSMWHMSS